VIATSPAYHDHSPQRLLQNFRNTTIWRSSLRVTLRRLKGTQRHLSRLSGSVRRPLPGRTLVGEMCPDMKSGRRRHGSVVAVGSANGPSRGGEANGRVPRQKDRWLTPLICWRQSKRGCGFFIATGFARAPVQSPLSDRRSDTASALWGDRSKPGAGRRCRSLLRR